MSGSRISADAQTALALLKPLLPPETYLAGGTALSLQLGHRLSYDLDLYTPKEFDQENLAVTWKTKIPHFEEKNIAWGTVAGIISETEVSISYYDYPLIDQTTEFEGITLAGLADIAAMKLEAIGGRGKRRDFFDLYTICQCQNYSLTDVIKLHIKKYGKSHNNQYHLLVASQYFIDADQESERIKLSKNEWETVKQFFRSQQKTALDFIVGKTNGF